MFILGKKPELVTTLKESIKDISLGKIQVMVNLISQKLEDSDWLRELRAVKPCIVPAFSLVYIKCKIKGDVKGESCTVICTSPVNGESNNELVYIYII